MTKFGKAVGRAPARGEPGLGARLASPALRRRQAERDGDDLIGFVAAGGRDLNAVAGALADQRAGQGRGHRQPAVADIGFVLADAPEGLLLLSLLVRKR